MHIQALLLPHMITKCSPINKTNNSINNSSENIALSMKMLSNYNRSFLGRDSVRKIDNGKVQAVQDKKDKTKNKGVYAINYDGRYIKYDTLDAAGAAFGMTRQAIHRSVKLGYISNALVKFVPADEIERKEIDTKELQSFLEKRSENEIIDITELQIDKDKIVEIAREIRENRPNPFYITC